MMHNATIAGVLVAGLALVAPPAGEGQPFTGTWEAKWHDRVICALRLRAADAMTGEMLGCSVRVNDDGDLLEPEEDVAMDHPEPFLNLKLEGKTLRFEADSDGETIRFELSLTGDGKADLTILDTPVKIKPIHFVRR